MSSRRAVSPARGLLFITAAKLWFMVAGYVLQFTLPRALGSPARYGLWTIVLSWLSLFNNVMVTATIQGVSKFTSEAEERRPAVMRAALRLQTFLGGGVALTFFLLAPLVAWFEHDDALTAHLRLASGVVLAYSFYAVFVGAANGTRAFHKQAGLDVTFATLRVSFVVGAALITHSALAAVGGFVAAAGVIVVVAAVWVGVGRAPAEGERMPVGALAGFFFGVAVYLLIVNALMFVDGILLKRLVTEWAVRRALSDPAQIANEQTGFYGAVQNVARIPYQLILAVTFVIFPLVSKATFEGDVERTRRYVRTTMRYSLVVAALFAAVLSARPEATMRLFYKPEYAVGASALGALLVGYVFFSLFTIAGTIINGAGRVVPTIAIGLATLAAAVGATALGIRVALSTGADPLLWAALGTTSAMAVGLGLAGLYLRRTFGAFLPLSTIARVALAYAAALAVGWQWDKHALLPGKLGTLVSASLCGLVYLGVAVLTGELRPSELRGLRRSTGPTQPE